MADLHTLHGMTIAINAGDFTEVLDFYTRVFGRGPDTTPMDDFLEWQICDGTWLQISTGHERPGANNARIRFEVEDIQQALARMVEARVPMGESVTVPQVVVFSNFSDNWGNALGFYQFLSPRQFVSDDERRMQEADAKLRRLRREALDRGEDPDLITLEEPAAPDAEAAGEPSEPGVAPTMEPGGSTAASAVQHPAQPSPATPPHR
ncbi:VOC family protein [Gephyromycinifex aptenodytis]|uniref:VOC family protein n=1 Tax=Gephyromycinifex aptenodytis TaxID=2716227 RepID=UPI0014468F08|nr:VOC family protein [Gephyromycinifex aptenodytis]